MITLRQAEERLKGAACPKCGKRRLTARLFLEETHPASCLCVAVCSACGHRFDIESEGPADRPPQR